MPKKKEETNEEDTKVEETQVEETTSGHNFDVSDPQVVKPQDLPLVVTPKKGKEWANDEQAEYARTLNGYAYKNPEKWQAKKENLLANLARLETEPGHINVLRGAKDVGSFSVKNKLIEN